MDDRVREEIKLEERIERRSVSMYGTDWALVDALAQRLGLDVSSTLRMLLRTHPDLRNGK